MVDDHPLSTVCRSERFHLRFGVTVDLADITDSEQPEPDIGMAEVANDAKAGKRRTRSDHAIDPSRKSSS
jgi:hypothetical protein